MALHEFNYEKEATVSIVKNILTDAIKMKASDIHFDPEPNKLLIKFRINGDLVEYTTAPESVKTNIITRVKIISGMNITEATIPQIGSINFELSSKTHNMRTTSIPVVDGEKLVIHLSNYAKNFKSLKSLGFEQENLDKIVDMLNAQDGIILITGVNSSGKTTSMYAVLQELSKKALNIISVENPIKMKLPGVNQVQINNEKGITYNSILKSILLSDPDVISINELINDETIRTALRASITGRLVISSMHTKTAFTTIKSLLNMDVENYLLGSNLNGIISQRLVKKLCPTCRETQPASAYEKRVIKEVLNEDIEEIYIPKGCEECQDGYVEQIPVVEVVEINDELRQAISNHRSEELIYNIIYSENDSIVKDIFKKVINGETSFDEAIKAIDVKTDLGSQDKKLKDLLLGKEINEDEETEESEPTEPQNKDNETPKEETTNNDSTDENKKDTEVEENNADKDETEKKDDEEAKEEASNKDDSENKEDDSKANDENQETTNNEEEKESPTSNEKAKDEIDDSILSNSELLKKALKIIENQLKDEETSKEQTEEPKNDEEISSKETDNAEEGEKVTEDNPKENKAEYTPTEEQKDEEKTSGNAPSEEPTTPAEPVAEEKKDDIVLNIEPIANNEEPKKEETPSNIVIPKDDNLDDDEDDDSFNYDSSYINNF